MTIRLPSLFNGPSTGIHRGRDRAVAIGKASRRKTALGSAYEPALRVGAQLLPVLLIEDPHDLRSDVEEIESGLDEDSRFLCGSEPVSNPSQVFDIPSEPRGVPGQKHIPLRKPRDEAQQPGTVVSRSAREPGFLDDEFVDHLPLPRCRMKVLVPARMSPRPVSRANFRRRALERRMLSSAYPTGSAVRR